MVRCKNETVSICFSLQKDGRLSGMKSLGLAGQSEYEGEASFWCLRLTPKMLS